MVKEYDLVVVYCYTFQLQICTELRCVNSKLMHGLASVHRYDRLCDSDSL